MTKPRDGGPAFPGGADEESPAYDRGMSLRDAFAIGALPSLLRNAAERSAVDGEPGALYGGAQGVANQAYIVADAMLKAREAGRG